MMMTVRETAAGLTSVFALVLDHVVIFIVVVVIIVVEVIIAQRGVESSAGWSTCSKKA